MLAGVRGPEKKYSKKFHERKMALQAKEADTLWD